MFFLSIKSYKSIWTILWCQASIIDSMLGISIMISKFRSLYKDKSGATAIEYGLIAALVSVAAVVALQNLGTSLNVMFSVVSGTLDAAVAGPTP